MHPKSIRFRAGGPYEARAQNPDTGGQTVGSYGLARLKFARVIPLLQVSSGRALFR
jgi:hypothetical protein